MLVESVYWKLCATVHHLEECLHAWFGGSKRKEHQGEAEAVFCPEVIEDSFLLTLLAFGLEGLQGLCSSAAL